MRQLASTFVRFLLTGLATLLPFIVTVFVVGWIVRIADAYIGPSSTFGLFILQIVGDSNKYSGYLAGYLVVVLLLVLLGFLVTRATISKIHDTINAMVARIPLFGKIYSGVGQVVEIFGSNRGNGLDRFGGVGYVKLGNAKMLVFLASAQSYTLADGVKHYMVFIPNSPIPLTGFNALVPEENFGRLEMPLEDMAKLLMSFGILGGQVLNRPLEVSHAEQANHERKTAP